MEAINKYTRTSAVKEGIRDGIPIGLGYLAVSFSLGIAGKTAGLSVFQATLASLLCNASAGEYAGFTVIASKATYIEMIIITLIANARYLLMSCAMSQRISPKTGLLHRLGMGMYVTDELFAIAVARPGYLNPFYTYGAVLMASPGWALGTALGAIAGNVLPVRVVSAFSVALYGMFLAVIIPPARKSKVISALILICFVASYFAEALPFLSGISSGTKIIILTIIISVGTALLFPKSEEGAN